MPILTEDEWLGRTVAQRYRLDEIFSAGGMGVLFRATDLESGERVAAKMLKPAFALDQQRVARFLRETRIAGALRSEHVAQVRAIWKDPDGTPFLIMELLDGRSLEDELETQGALGLERTLAIAVQVANALSAAHRAGIVHRDVKPANIFLCENEPGEPKVKLLDFGIAKDEADDFETQTGAVLGTPSYMAPEQVQHGDSGPYTDVWGLGAVVYRCLSGHPPHCGDSTREVLAKALRESVPPLVVPGVSRLVCAVIDRALSREPHRRYSDVESFLQALITAKLRGGAPAGEVSTGTRASETAAIGDVDSEREIGGAASTAAPHVPARSFSSVGFLALGAALAVGFMAWSEPPPARSVLSKRNHGSRMFYRPAAPSAPASAGTPSARSVAAVMASAPRAATTAKPRVRPIQPAPPATTPAPEAPVERHSKSGLVVVTEW